MHGASRSASRAPRSQAPLDALAVCATTVVTLSLFSAWGDSPYYRPATFLTIFALLGWLARPLPTKTLARDAIARQACSVCFVSWCLWLFAGDTLFMTDDSGLKSLSLAVATFYVFGWTYKNFLAGDRRMMAVVCVVAALSVWQVQNTHEMPMEVVAVHTCLFMGEFFLLTLIRMRSARNVGVWHTLCSTVGMLVTPIRPYSAGAGVMILVTLFLAAKSMDAANDETLLAPIPAPIKRPPRVVPAPVARPASKAAPLPARLTFASDTENDDEAVLEKRQRRDAGDGAARAKRIVPVEAPPPPRPAAHERVVVPVKFSADAPVE